MDYKSEGELHFSWWLDDLLKHGIITRYAYESNRFTMAEAKKYPYLKKMVTKSKIVELQLLEEHVYTPDFLVEWNKDYDGIYFRDIDGLNYYTKPPFFSVKSKKNDKSYTFFEVKPIFDHQNMTRLFRISQKWLYDKYRLYVELAIIPTLFKNTFTPERYLYTDKTQKLRKINHDVRSIEQYTAKLKSKILVTNGLF